MTAEVNAPTKVPDTLQSVEALPTQIRVGESVHTLEWYECVDSGFGERNAVLYYYTASGCFKWSQHVTIGGGDLARDIVARAKHNRYEGF